MKVVLAIWQEVEGFRRSLSTPASYVCAASQRDEDVVPLIADADVLIAGRFSAGMAAAATKLRLIQTPGAGTNAIELDAVPGRTTVCNVYGHERGIAEYVFTTMGMLNRDYVGMNQRIRQGDWSDHLGDPKPELQGRTLAVMGLGRIGREVARWGRFLEMRVVAATRSPQNIDAHSLGLDRLAGIDELESVLAEADFVTVCVPLSPETTNLIAERQLAAMKPEAFLINVARGEVVDEAALFAALRHRSIAGAAIDVWYQYPDGRQTILPSQLPFHELSNVIMTPHIAGATDATFQYRWRLINENLHRLEVGEPLANIVKASST